MQLLLPLEHLLPNIMINPDLPDLQIINPRQLNIQGTHMPTTTLIPRATCDRRSDARLGTHAREDVAASAAAAARKHQAVLVGLAPGGVEQGVLVGAGGEGLEAVVGVLAVDARAVGVARGRVEGSRVADALGDEAAEGEDDGYRGVDEGAGLEGRGLGVLQGGEEDCGLVLVWRSMYST